MNFELTAAEAFLLDISLKAALVLATAWALCLLFRHASAACRHAIWGLAICSMLLLPLLAALLPAYQFSVAAPKTVAISGSEVRSREVDLLLAWSPSTDDPMNASRQLQSSPPAPAAIENATSAEDITRGPSQRAAISWLIPVWSLGCCLALLPTSLGIASLWRLSRRARPITSGPLLTTLHQTMDELGFRRSLRLLESPERVIPMTWNLLRPTILLPQAASAWPRDKQRLVLLHELAHLQRHDCTIQLLAQLARAIYWFNPLVWWAQRQLVTLQEQACDDVVLARGCQAPVYAEQLLSVAAGFPLRTSAVGLSMVTNLETRLLSILNPQQSRRPISPRQLAFIGLAAITLVIPLSMVRHETAVAAEQAGQDTGQANQPAPAADRTQTLAELRAKITEQYLTPVNEQNIVRGALKGMVGALGDPYSDYLTPDMLAQMESQIKGSIVGIGAQLETADKQVRVVTPLEGSPARKAGIRPGDILLEIDGEPTTGVDLTDVVKRILGPQGSTVRLKIRRQGGQDLDLAVTRDTVKLPTVKGFLRASDDRWNYLLDPTQKIAYIHLTQLGSTTPQELRSVLESLKQQNVQGLILDLRFCPGGLLESAVATAKLFVNSGTIVSLQSRKGDTDTILADGTAQFTDAPLVVLANGQTASAAEVLAGALQDNQRALVLGTRTIGKGSVQSLIKLSEGNGAVKLTTAEYRLPSGRNIDRRPGEPSWGINPTEGYFVPVDRATLPALRQRQQERDLLGGRQIDPPATDLAKWIEEQQSDPQLAKALSAMSDRLRTGRLTKVSDLSTVQIEQFIKREGLEQRREMALKTLSELDRELAEATRSP
jgi:carboxyl-terminal processing protease